MERPAFAVSSKSASGDKCPCTIRGCCSTISTLVPDRQRNFVAAREQHLRQAKPAANQGAISQADTTRTDERSGQNAGDGCFGHRVDVGIDLVYRLDRAFTVDAAVLA